MRTSYASRHRIETAPLCGCRLISLFGSKASSAPFHSARSMVKYGDRWRISRHSSCLLVQRLIRLFNISDRAVHLPGRQSRNSSPIQGGVDAVVDARRTNFPPRFRSAEERETPPPVVSAPLPGDSEQSWPSTAYTSPPTRAAAARAVRI